MQPELRPHSLDPQGVQAPRRVLGAAVLGLVSAIGLTGCMGGNSGAEGGTESTPGGGGGGADTVPCPCRYLSFFANQTGVSLRVTLKERLAGNRIALKLEEVLHGELPAEVGARLEATWDGELPCITGCSDVAVGDQAFAFFWIEPRPCEARETCIEDCHADNAAAGHTPWEIESACSDTVHLAYDTGPDCVPECREETEAACEGASEDQTVHGRAVLAPWADPIVFARGDLGELSVPLDDLEDLLTADDVRTCVQRFGDWTDVSGGERNGV